MNKKGFIETEIIASPGFVILVAMAVGATLIGWTMSPSLGIESRFPLWQVVVIILVEIVACYLMVARGS